MIFKVFIRQTIQNKSLQQENLFVRKLNINNFFNFVFYLCFSIILLYLLSLFGSGAEIFSCIKRIKYYFTFAFYYFLVLSVVRMFNFFFISFLFCIKIYKKT